MMGMKDRMGNRRDIGKPGTVVVCAILGCFSAMAFMWGQKGYLGLSELPASSASYLWSALALVFAALYGLVLVWKGLRPRLMHIAIGFLFGMLNVFGGILFAYDTWSSVYGPLNLARTILQCAGQGLPMAVFVTLLDVFLRGGYLTRRSVAPRKERFPSLHRLYREHTAGLCMAWFVLCWVPYLFIFYPGTLSWDMGEMLAQYFGQRPMDTWHPVFLTWAVGGCMWLGRLLGSDNAGAFLFTLIQTVGLAYALARAILYMRRMNASRAVQGAALCFFGLAPIWGGYAQFICKDTLYTAALLLFTLDTLWLVRQKGALSGRELIGYGTATLLSCLIRSNGAYVVLPTAILATLWAARGRTRLRAGLTLGAAFLLVMLFSMVLLPNLGIKDETASGLYSVCFQQSARTLRDHGDRVTAEEYAELNLVLDADRIPDLYEPWISDPVKFTFRTYGQGAAIERETLARYRKTWLAMLPKYPATYLEAFVAGNSGYYAFIPKLEEGSYNNQAGNRLVFETHPQVAENLGIRTSYLPSLETLRVGLALFARGWRHIPLLALLYSCAAYTWLLLAAGASLAGRRRWREMIVFAPALLSFATCLLSPVNDYFRYFLPVVAMAPPLLVWAGGGEADPAQKTERLCQVEQGSA